MIIRRLIVPLTVALVTCHAGQGFAQGAFPAPLPNGQAAPSNASPFPPVNGAAPAASIGGPSSFPSAGAAPITGTAFERGPAPPSQAGGPPDDCMKTFLPLREETEKRGKILKAAGGKGTPDQACKMLGNYGQAELKMLKFVESNSARCGIPPQVGDQMKASHKNTEAMKTKVCGMAQQVQQRGPAGPSLSEVLGSSAAAPEATATRKGGSTFDTLNGNVLTR